MPNNTYIIAYDNNDAEDDYVRTSVYSNNIIPVSLRDISCVERIATVLRKQMLKEYFENTLLKVYDIPRILSPYYDVLSEYIQCIKINKKESNYVFIKYPITDFDRNKFRDVVITSKEYKEKGRMEQKKISDALDNFIDDYELYSMNLCDNLRCFDPDCSLPINNRQCVDLSYIVCSCGYVLDTTMPNNLRYYRKDSLFTPEELGMDYLVIVQS